MSLLHRDDESLDQLQTYQDAENAIEIAKYDDAGNYRPLKTAPNLRHGWRLELATVEELGDVRWIIFIQAGSRFSRRGKAAISKRRPCATHWIVSQECIALPQRFPIHKSTISCRGLLSVRWRMPQNYSMETRSERCNRIDEIAEREI